MTHKKNYQKLRQSVGYFETLGEESAPVATNTSGAFRKAVKQQRKGLVTDVGTGGEDREGNVSGVDGTYIKVTRFPIDAAFKTISEASPYKNIYKNRLTTADDKMRTEADQFATEPEKARFTAGHARRSRSKKKQAG